MSTALNRHCDHKGTCPGCELIDDEVEIVVSHRPERVADDKKNALKQR